MNVNRVNGSNGAAATAGNNGGTVRSDRAGSNGHEDRGGSPYNSTTTTTNNRYPNQRVIEIPVQHIKTGQSMPSYHQPQPPPPPGPSHGSGASRLFRETSPFANSSRLIDPGNFGSGFGSAFDNSDFFDRFDKEFGKFFVCFVFSFQMYMNKLCNSYFVSSSYISFIFFKNLSTYS